MQLYLPSRISMAITKLVLWEILCLEEGPSNHLCREGMHFPFPLLHQANVDIVMSGMREMQDSELRCGTHQAQQPCTYEMESW